MNRTTGRRAGCLALPILCLLSVLSGTAASETRSTYGALTPAPETLRACTLPDMTPGKVQLETDCRYTEPVVISSDNVLLDCRGGTITGMHRRGITIRPGLKNITIRDCRLDDTGGILIEGQTPSDDAAARDDARANSSQGVVLDHLTITKSYMTGVFVDHYVVGATIRNSIVADGHHVGIYLEHGSQKNVVSGNLIRNIKKVGPYPPEVAGFGIGIAVEADTTLTGNVVEGAPKFGLMLGWGPYMRNIAASQNVVRDCGTGIAVTVVDGAGAAVITNNIVQGSQQGAINGYRWLEKATGELNNVSEFDNLTVHGNQIAA